MPFNDTCEHCGKTLIRRTETGRFPRFCFETCRSSVEREDTPERFWANVERAGHDECWPWIGNRNSDEYGRMGFGKAIILSHRVSFFLAHGRFPEPDCLHTCDNPPCCNPAHLYEGTPTNNVSDAIQRGRHKRPPVHLGEAAHTAKLTPDAVRDIRFGFASGETQRSDS